MKNKIEIQLSNYILGESIKANIDITDVVVYLAHHGYELRDIANKILNNEMYFDDFTPLVSNAINTLKEDPTIIDKWLFRDKS